MFERFTMQARRAMVTARMMATEAGRTVIEPGDLVLGVVFQDGDRTIAGDEKAALLAALGTIDLSEPQTTAQVPFSDSALAALAASGRVADSYGHKWIRPEHLLSGVAHDQSSAAAQAISIAGINPAALVHSAVEALPDDQIEPPERQSSSVH